MRDNETGRWRTYEPFYVMLGDIRISDIVITSHAGSRYADRIHILGPSGSDVSAWLWQCLKQNRVRPYSRTDKDVYVVDNDVVMVARTCVLAGESVPPSELLHRLTVVTFLGRMSETIELRDLKTYFARLRRPRPQTFQGRGKGKGGKRRQ